LLVLPPDIDRPGADPRLVRFGACPRGPLPFASYLVAGPDEPAELRHSLSQLARDWSASFVSEEVGTAEWPDGQWLLDRLIRRETGPGSVIPTVASQSAVTEMVVSTDRRIEAAP
jgi:predicted alpha/beta hydrolase family esterase